jgi:hypothetical protein
MDCEPFALPKRICGFKILRDSRLDAEISSLLRVPHERLDEKTSNAPAAIFRGDKHLKDAEKRKSPTEQDMTGVSISGRRLGHGYKEFS